jgi:hypothetical protein
MSSISRLCFSRISQAVITPPRTAVFLNPQNGYRWASTLKNNGCRCGSEKLPDIDKITQLFRQRDFRRLTEDGLRCAYYGPSKFKKAQDCRLIASIEATCLPILRQFKDVTYIGSSLVFLDCLNPIPEGDFGDLTGDHGKQLARFLGKCLEKKDLPKIGSIFDIGGQNTSTITLLRDVFDDQKLPSMIVDINLLTPALTPPLPNLQYVIGDALEFFSSKHYDIIVRNVVNNDPSLFIFNNILNILRAEAGWRMLKAAWSRLRGGDYLIVSGLVPEQLEKHNSLKKYCEVGGVIEFHDRKGFYKSALSEGFFKFIKEKLTNSSVVVAEAFIFDIETNPTHSTMKIEGRRLLALKKLVTR